MEQQKILIVMDSQDAACVYITKGESDEISIETKDEILCRLWPDQLKLALIELGFDEFKDKEKRKRK